MYFDIKHNSLSSDCVLEEKTKKSEVTFSGSFYQCVVEQGMNRGFQVLPGLSCPCHLYIYAIILKVKIIFIPIIPLKLI